MLEGLEISEVTHQIFLNENEDLRFDAEFFQKRFLKENFIRSKYENLILGDSNTSFITDGQHGYHEVDYSSQIHMLTAKNTKNWFANITDAEPIARWVDEKNKRSSLAVDDIILSTRGTVGLCAIVRSEILPANIDQDIARIKLLTDRIYPEYLLAYLNSRFGQDWMLRNQTGMVQQGLSLQKVRTFPIPILSDTFQTTLKYLINKVYKINTKVQKKYTNAENLLLKELGLQNWQPTQETITEKKMSDFLSSGRFDAEYYQPKYDEIEERLSSFPKIPIHQIYDYIQNTSPSLYFDNGCKVIKTKNVRIPAIDFDTITDFSQEINIQIEMGDLVFAAMGVGSLGRMSYVFEKNEPCTTDGTLRIFRTKTDFRNHFYEIPTMLFLTSPIGQELIYRHIIGSTGIISISKESILNLQIPIIDLSIRKECDTLVKQSYELHQESKRLLDLAKFTVEVAIEQGEEEAIKMLNTIDYDKN